MSACPLQCGSARAPVLALRARGYDIFRCPDCGAGRVRAEGFRPEQYYDEAYFNGGRDGAYTDYVGSEGVLRHEFREQLDFLTGFVPGGKLLEIGCAYGFFLREARRRFEVFGVEVAPAAVAHCHASGLTNVRQGELDAEWLALHGPFDAIAMLDVIEHIDDVGGTMELALRHLRPGGVLLVTTGDWSSRFARVMGASWRLIAPPLHLWYLTPDSLRRLFARFGLRQVHLSRPWKRVPVSLILDQAAAMLRLPRPRPAGWLSRLGLPANLFDAMRMVFRKDVD